MRRKQTKVFQQSGIIPYRVRDGKIEVLLVTNHGRKHWVIPKGGISKGMAPPDSAAKEAWEEAGVVGQVDTNKLGTYKYHKRGNAYCVEVFLLLVETVLSDWPEASRRKRRWLNITKAVKRVKPAELKRILKTTSKLVAIQADGTQTEQLAKQAAPLLKHRYVTTTALPAVMRYTKYKNTIFS